MRPKERMSPTLIHDPQPPAPIPRPNLGTTPPRNSVLRASVFDAFIQLGGLEQNSTLADWIFSDPNESLDTKARVKFDRLQSDNGSKFHERLDSDSEDRRTSRSTETHRGSRVSRIFSKARSKSRGRDKRAKEAEPKEKKRSKEEPLRSSSRKSFLGLKSRSFVDIKETLKEEEELRAAAKHTRSGSDTPTLTHEGDRSTDSEAQPATPVAHPSDTISIADDWERVSMLSLGSPKPADEVINPFLHGADKSKPSEDGLDSSKSSSRFSSESKDSHHSVQRLSIRTFILPSASKRSSFFSLKRSSRAPTPSSTPSVPNSPLPPIAQAFIAKSRPASHVPPVPALPPSLTKTNSKEQPSEAGPVDAPTETAASAGDKTPTEHSTPVIQGINLVPESNTVAFPTGTTESDSDSMYTPDAPPPAGADDPILPASSRDDDDDE